MEDKIKKRWWFRKMDRWFQKKNCWDSAVWKLGAALWSVHCPTSWTACSFG